MGQNGFVHLLVDASLIRLGFSKAEDDCKKEAVTLEPQTVPPKLQDLQVLTSAERSVTCPSTILLLLKVISYFWPY